MRSWNTRPLSLSGYVTVRFAFASCVWSRAEYITCSSIGVAPIILKDLRPRNFTDIDIQQNDHTREGFLDGRHRRPLRRRHCFRNRFPPSKARGESWTSRMASLAPLSPMWGAGCRGLEGQLVSYCPIHDLLVGHDGLRILHMCVDQEEEGGRDSLKTDDGCVSGLKLEVIISSSGLVSQTIFSPRGPPITCAKISLTCCLHPWNHSTNSRQGLLAFSNKTWQTDRSNT